MTYQRRRASTQGLKKRRCSETRTAYQLRRASTQGLKKRRCSEIRMPYQRRRAETQELKKRRCSETQELENSETHIVFLADYNASEKTVFNIG